MASTGSDPDLIVAFEISTGELKDLRRDPATRLVPMILITEHADAWPDGADVVIRLPASPHFVAGQVEALWRRLSIERSVSPLSGLPGAFSAEMEMDSRFSSGSPFHVSYIDINNFKPFNDAYGFEKGDMIIRALSSLVKDSLSRFQIKQSFCGHVGGDDFLVLSSGDPEEAMKWLAFEFDRQMRSFYTETDLSRGGIVSFDREGRRKKFPLMSISVVSLCCGKGLRNREEISH
ncbi:MAG: diguanylate cyclase, partial [bacterium]